LIPEDTCQHICDIVTSLGSIYRDCIFLISPSPTGHHFLGHMHRSQDQLLKL